MRSSPAKGWAKTGQVAPPLALAPPPREGRAKGGVEERVRDRDKGKEEQGRR